MASLTCLGLAVTLGLGLGLGSAYPVAAQATAGVVSRAWVLPLHSLLAPEAQLKVLGPVEGRLKVRVGNRGRGGVGAGLSLLAPEAQLKVLGLVEGRGRVGLRLRLRLRVGVEAGFRVS